MRMKLDGAGARRRAQQGARIHIVIAVMGPRRSVGRSLAGRQTAALMDKWKGEWHGLSHTHSLVLLLLPPSLLSLLL